MFLFQSHPQLKDEYLIYSFSFLPAHFEIFIFCSLWELGELFSQPLFNSLRIFLCCSKVLSDGYLELRKKDKWSDFSWLYNSLGNVSSNGFVTGYNVLRFLCEK